MNTRAKKPEPHIKRELKTKCKECNGTGFKVMEQ